MQNAARAPENFESIPFPVRSFGGLSACRYLVYSSPQESKEVEAETAAEALKKSGLKEALRIVRYMPGREVLIETEKLLGNAGAPVPASVPESAPPAADAA